MALLNESHMTPYQRIEVINAVRGKLPIDYSTEMTIIPVEFEEQSSRIPVIIPEREKIKSFFEDFYAMRGVCRLLYRTTAEWDSDPELIAQKGNIYVYIDADSYIDPVTGETVYVPAIKLGDDVTPLIDLPFVESSTAQFVIDHIQDSYIHIQEGEREALRAELNNKVNLDDVNEPIIILESSGIFTEDEFNALSNNLLKRIQYGDNLYVLTVKRNGVRRYTATSSNPNTIPYIDVDSSNMSWSCGTNYNTVLDNHINDNVRHITAEERTFWNNKLNCTTVSEERLIFNRN